mgnify:CR=1 FL=1
MPGLSGHPSAPFKGVSQLFPLSIWAPLSSDSPACVVADSNDPTAQMQELFKQMGQGAMPNAKPIFEINPKHSIIKKLSKMNKTKSFDDSILLLFDQALLVSNIKIENPGEFISRINKVLEKSL